MPYLLAGDPSDSGLWLWAATATTSDLYHVDGRTAAITTYTIGSDAVALAHPAKGGLAVGPNGNIWLGTGTALFELVPSSGKLQQFTLPGNVITDNGAAESYRPREMQGVHGIQAMAVSPDGQHVALGLSADTTVAIFDVNTGSFSSIPLPNDTDAISLMYTSNSTISIGIGNYVTHQTDELLSGNVGGSLYANTVPDASALMNVGNSLVAGSLSPAVITGEDGPNAASSSLMNNAIPFSEATGTYPLTSDEVLLTSAQTLVVESISSRQVESEIPIPASNQHCAYPIPPSAQTPTVGGTSYPSALCGSAPTSVTTDGQGDAWLIGVSAGYLSELVPSD